MRGIKEPGANNQQREMLNGPDLREMFAASCGWLEKSAAEIDALNVFPVPDGDTGTNMLLTMRSILEEAQRISDKNVSVMVQAMARGALMGARGNSGVILSQIMRGLASGLSDKEAFTGVDLAGAFLQAAQMAYRGLTNPVEGTILTVMKDAATAARAQADTGVNDPVSVMEAAATAMRESVANTPLLLPALREAGVVDAGGQGLYTIFDGMLRYLKGESQEMKYRKPVLVASSVPLATHSTSAAEEISYGYCTEFIIRGHQLKPDKIRANLSHRGKSLIVVGDEATVRVHIHTDNPGGVVRYGTLRGTLHKISVRNMDEQHQGFLGMQRERMPAVDVGIVAVVSGEGLARVFQSLGAMAIVSGGQTMNPSTKELLEAIESVPADNVILLPNDKNIIMTAQQVPPLTRKKVSVVPTTTIPQGITALLSFDYEADFAANVKIMEQVRMRVKTITISRAVRSTQVNRLSIKKRQFIAFLEGDLVEAGNSPGELIARTMDRLKLDNAEVITLYHGAETEAGEAEEIGNKLREKYPGLQVEVVRGDQPNFHYIISIE